MREIDNYRGMRVEGQGNENENTRVKWNGRRGLWVIDQFLAQVNLGEPRPTNF